MGRASPFLRAAVPGLLPAPATTRSRRVASKGQRKLGSVGQAGDVRQTVELIVRQVAHWQQPRWAAVAAGGNVSRGDLVHRLVQQIANLAADAEAQPRRAVPRLDSDLALPDQLRVVTADLLAAEASTAALAWAASEAAATRAALCGPKVEPAPGPAPGTVSSDVR